VLGAANVVQTVPSLALFGLLIPVPLIGIGSHRAGRADALRDPAGAAERRRRHHRRRPAGRARPAATRHVRRAAASRAEWPLGARVVLAGVRLATVIGIGLATIAAAIGAGGLGVFIFRGVAMVDNRTILAGALPAAALALTADGILGAIEHRLRPPR
jgi:osmoprotectant transport system permease protein